MGISSRILQTFTEHFLLSDPHLMPVPALWEVSRQMGRQTSKPRITTGSKIAWDGQKHRMARDWHHTAL